MSRTGQNLEVLLELLNVSLPLAPDERAAGKVALQELQDSIMKPVPMRLPCEVCGKLHIDEGVFLTKPHHTHTCQYCGLTWRPAIGCTVGVQFLPGFRNVAAP